MSNQCTFFTSSPSQSPDAWECGHDTNTGWVSRELQQVKWESVKDQRNYYLVQKASKTAHRCGKQAAIANNWTIKSLQICHSSHAAAIRKSGSAFFLPNSCSSPKSTSSLCSSFLVCLEALSDSIPCLTRSGGKEPSTSNGPSDSPGPGDRQRQSDSNGVRSRWGGRGWWGSGCAALHRPKPAMCKIYVKSERNWELQDLGLDHLITNLISTEVKIGEGLIVLQCIR